MRILPKSLFGRLVLLLLAGLVVAQLLSAVILLRDRGQVLYESMRRNLIVRAAGIVRVLDSMEVRERRRILPLLGGAEMRVMLVDRPPAMRNADADSTVAARLVRARLGRHLPEHAEIRVFVEGHVMPNPMQRRHRRHANEGGPGPWGYVRGVHAMARFFHIQVRLSDGNWVLLEQGVSDSHFDWPIRLLSVLGILLVSVVLLSLVGVRSIVRPLRDLRRAAEGLGRDIRRPPLDVRGPEEVRETARAFNTMQLRLKNYIEDRAGVLAAVSHDLKTPLTRIRLRTDLMDDEDTRGRIQKDLDDMESMVSATLDFMRGTETAEPTQKLDLAALLESIQSDAEDMGQAVRVSGQPARPYDARPLALKRCIANLVDNAVRYGGQAEISVRDGEREVVISICDAGPGIPEDALQRVFDPFHRLESSRGKDTGGTGLGLGIARNIARAHGGDLVLSNRPGGGLCATLTLPR